MGSWIALALTVGGLAPPAAVFPADDPFALPPAVAEDRRRLADAVKAASRCGAEGRPSAADFDALIRFAWSPKPAHHYILPLELEDALRRHDAANPGARLGGPPLDFHAADRNLVLCLAGIHAILQDALCEYLTDAVGKEVEPTTLARVVVEHLQGLPPKSRADFIAKLVMAQGCLRSALRESALGLVSDEAHCEKVVKRAHRVGEEPAEVKARIAQARKEFNAAFEKCLKAAADRAKRK